MSIQKYNVQLTQDITEANPAQINKYFCNIIFIRYTYPMYNNKLNLNLCINI